MPSPRARVLALLEAALHQVGGRKNLAHYLAVTPNAITEWKHGRAAPNALHLIRLQDLVKKAACVLIALAGLIQAPDSGATGTPSAAGTGARTAPDTLINYTLHIVQQLARQLRAAWRRLLLKNEPFVARPSLA